MAQNSSLVNNLFDRDLVSDVKKEEEFNRVLRKQRGNNFKFLRGQQEAYWQWHAKMAEQYHLSELQAAMEATEAGTEARMIAEKRFQKARLTAEQRTVAIIASIEGEAWRTTYGLRDRDIRELQQRQIDASREAAQAQLKEAITSAAGQIDAVDRIAEANKQYREKVREALEKEWELKKNHAKHEEKEEARLHVKRVSLASKFAKRKEELDKKAAEERQKYDDMRESGAYTEAEMEEQATRVREAEQDSLVQGGLQESLAKFSEQIASRLANFVESAFHDAEDIMTTYQSHMNARLQGSATNFQEALDLAVDNTAASIFVQTKDVLESMRKLNDEGVAYNLEQRAFLGTISDKIANTFDAFDSNLARLIRLQQADTTAARLGMEASLTKLFNSMFQDTSYLTQLSDSVSAALLDAQSLMEKNAATEFDYVVQKWMGSLYSLGISDQAINSIAEGLNMLGTGDVAGLASNSSLQTLFAMSSANAGLEYSQLLLEGLDASSTNKLLKSMVSYLKTIAEGSENQVVRAAYGNIFNMRQSDFAALSNLTEGDISTISNTMLSYSNMKSELTNQFAQLITRMSMSEMLSNITSNATFGLGMEMVRNPVLFATNKMLDAMDALGLEINIPFISAMGNGLDLNASVNDIMRLGTGIGGAMGLLGTILTNLGSSGGLNLDSWGEPEYTTRGSGLSLLMSSMVGGTSGTAYVTTSNSGAMQDSALSNATSDAEETSKITNKNHEVEVTFDDFYKATVGESSSSYIVVQDTILGQVFDGDNKLRVRDDMLLELWGRVMGDAGDTDVRVKDNTLISVFDDSIDVKLAQVQVDEGALLVKVKNTADMKATIAPAFSASGNSSGIDEATLVSAFKKAFSDEGSETLIKLFKDVFANTGFQIKGYPGVRIPVGVEYVAPTVSSNTRR